MVGGWFGWKPPAEEKLYRVVEVYDGDSFRLENNQHIRLATVDAPENNRCGYMEAKKSLEELILDKEVKIEGNINANGRLLATVYLGDQVVNVEQARRGWARHQSQKSSKRAEIQAAGNEAKKEKRGVYGLCVEKENSRQPPCSIKGNNRDVDNGGKDKIYSFKGCGSYNNTEVDLDLGDEWFCTAGQAEAAGYVRAANCH